MICDWFVLANLSCLDEWGLIWEDATVLNDGKSDGDSNFRGEKLFVICNGLAMGGLEEDVWPGDCGVLGCDNSVKAYLSLWLGFGL